MYELFKKKPKKPKKTKKTKKREKEKFILSATGA